MMLLGSSRTPQTEADKDYMKKHENIRAMEPKPGQHTGGKFRSRKLFLAGVLWLTG
jgi:hypothetical protein